MASGKRQALMKKLRAASASGVGNNFKDGKYRLAVKKMSLEDGFKGSRFQVAFLVMAASKIPVQSVKTGDTLNIEPNPVGSSVDWLQMLDDKDSPGPGNVRRLMLDLFNKKEIDDDEYIDTLAEMADIDADGEPLKKPLELAKGMVIDMETIRIETKTNKKEIVVCKWSHVAQSEDERVAVVTWMDQVAAAQAAQAALPA